MGMVEKGRKKREIEYMKLVWRSHTLSLKEEKV